MSFAIVTDSGADLPDFIIEREGLYYASNMVILGEREYKDRVEFTRNDLLRAFERGELITTSQAPPAEIHKAYSLALENYDRVLAIHLSHKLSGVLNNANAVAQEFGDRVVLFDTLNVSIGMTYLVEVAYKLREAGKSLEETVETLEKAKDRISIYVALNNLDTVRRGGRVRQSQFLLAKLLRIKPVLTVKDGLVVKSFSAFGRRSLVKKLYRKAIEEFGDVERPYLITAGVNDKGVSQKLKMKLVDSLNPSIIWETGLSAVILAHTGPYVIGYMLAPSLESWLN